MPGDILQGGGTNASRRQAQAAADLPAVSAALRMAQHLEGCEDVHPSAELFLSVLFAPVYGRRVSLHREPVHGRIVTSSQPIRR
ncbi:MAG: hypothetical protein OXG35_04410 [Acidobacteria bacterium]|nr:hypothetical protein [Acidobacteriota bacterium]